MPQQAILVVNDLHCGSIYGMMPPDFSTSAGCIQNQNAGQRYLWECWKDLTSRVSGLPIVALVVNGDAIDGEERKSRGAELCMPLLEDQSECAAECLRYLHGSIKSKPRIFVTRGTPYHDSEGGREAESLAEKIGARPYVGYGAGRRVRRAFDLEIDGVVVNFSHGVPCSGGLYRATAPDREAVWSALAGKEGKAEKADAIVRAHAHYYVHLEHSSKHAIINPCWQLQTDYMGKNSVYRMIPDIGATVIWLDPEAKKRKEDPIRVQKILYSLPKIGTAHI